MDVSIVILNYNTKDYLKGCLESLAQCSKSRQVEIIVSDNASTDGSIEMVESEFPKVRLLKNTENLGFTKGNNVGIRASTGKYVYLVNTDTKVLDGCVDALADFLDQHTDVAVTGPKVLNSDLTLQCSCRKDPSLWNNFCAVTGLDALFPNSSFFSSEQMFYFKGDQSADTDILVGCFSAVRRKAIDEVGLLDEGFYMYGDELDWCRRFRLAGWRIVYHPEAQTIHYGGGTSKKDPVRASLLQQESILRYWNKYHGFAGCFGIKCLLFLRLGSRWVRSFAMYLAVSSKRTENGTHMRTSSACLQALFGLQTDLGGSSTVSSNPAGSAARGTCQTVGRKSAVFLPGPLDGKTNSLENDAGVQD